MLEVEVLGEQAVDFDHVHEVVEVYPLGPALLVELLLLDGCDDALAVGPDEVGEAVLGVLGVLLGALHLELDDDLLLKQEVLEVLEGDALQELLPDGQFVLVLLVADGLLELLVVHPGEAQQQPDDEGLVLAVLLAAELVHDREEEDDLVALVEQEVGVLLDLVDQLLVFCLGLVDLVVVLELLALHVLVGLLDLAVVDGAFEVLLLAALLHQVHRVLHHLLLLAELAGVDDHQVLVQVQLAYVFAETAVHRQRQRELLLHLLLDVPGDLVLEELLPAEAFLGVGLEHAPDEVLAHVGDVVDGPGEVEVLLGDHGLELIDVFGVVRRPGLRESYLPKSIQ